ncbi:MAG: hypothetical protein HQ581_20730 [Planctomycetes bacterium]|nr:hypothetical protein [Planctomycetota bacterium]
MAKTYLSLQQSEGYIVLAAAKIYAAYVGSDRFEEAQEEAYMEKSIRDAIRIAKTVDAAIIAEGEMDA